MNPFQKHTIFLWVGGHVVREPTLTYSGGTSHVYKGVDIDEICFMDFFQWYKQAFRVDPRALNVYYIMPNVPFQEALKKIVDDVGIIEMQKAHTREEIIKLWMEESCSPIMSETSKGNVLHGPIGRKPLELPAPEGWNPSIFHDSEFDIDGEGEDQVNEEDEVLLNAEQENVQQEESVDVDEVSDTDEWMAEDFEAPYDDDIFIERADDHEVQEYRKYKLAMKKEASRLEAIHEAKKNKTQFKSLGAGPSQIMTQPGSTPKLVRKPSCDTTPSGQDPPTMDDEMRWYTSDDTDSDGELDRHLVSDDEQDICEYEEWKEKNYPDMDKFNMTPGMLFPTRGAFREVLRDWVVRSGWDIELKKSERERISAVCKHGCDWYIYASKKPNTTTYQVKRLRGEHKCTVPRQNSQATYKYIGKRLMEKFRENPTMSLEQMQKKVYKKMRISPSNYILYRSRRYALELIAGDIKEEYKRLYDYSATVCKENEGSKLVLKLNRDVTPPMFERMYFGLKGMKDGFLAGCRRIIGLDGCFLKGIYKGQLLTAIGRDANDNMFPIAMAVVRTESFDSWKWFLDILLSEIGSYEDHGWSFISDRQKGLIAAVEEVTSVDAEHRFCVRHMYNNFKSKFKGLDMKQLFWSAASAGTVAEFNTIMEEINKTYPQGEENEETPYVWLSKIEAKHWARSHFPTRTKCCSLVNNMSESFNNYILGARDLPIISMWEWIRTKLMGRIQVKLQGMQSYDGTVCPNIMRKMKKEWLLRGRNCHATFAGNESFQVEYFREVHAVKLDERTCTCGFFQLRGYPCLHAMAAIEVHRENREKYVDPIYSKDMYLRTYNHMIHPVPGMKFYVQTGKGPIDPPDVPVKLGRPKKNRRKDGNDIRDPTKASRKGEGKSCTKCLGIGHNSATCKNPIHHKSKHYQANGGDDSSQNPANSPSIPKKTPSWVRKQKPQPPRTNVYVVPPPAPRPARAPTHPKTTNQVQLNTTHNTTRSGPSHTQRKQANPQKRSTPAATSSINPPAKKQRQHKLTIAEVLNNMKKRTRGPL